MNRQQSEQMDDWTQPGRGVGGSIYTHAALCAALARLPYAGGLPIALINYDYADVDCPWSSGAFWPWSDHPRAQWVGDEAHVLE